MKNEVIITSYIPYQNQEIACQINFLHKKVLDRFNFQVPSNNTEWINKKNVIGFFAQDIKTKKILCAYRHEFIFNKNEIGLTPFLNGVNTSLHGNLMSRLNNLIQTGPYSETCAFWSAPEMNYKKSNLSRYLFTYGIISSLLNGTENVLGLAPLKLVDYYTSYGLETDTNVIETINYSKQQHPSKFVLYNKNNSNKIISDEVNNCFKTGSQLKLLPYENTYLNIERPTIIFNNPLYCSPSLQL